MLQRMSILEARPQGGPDFFSRHWEGRHAPLVAGLLHIRAYVQNHVQQAFQAPEKPPPFRVSGIVELLFNDAAARQAAFSSAVVAGVTADEANFLGHSSGYIVEDARIHPAGQGGKLLAVLARDGEDSLASHLESVIPRLPSFTALIRNRVARVLDWPGSAKAAQHVDVLFHAYFQAPEQARKAGPMLAAQAGDGARLGVYQVRTVAVR